MELGQRLKQARLDAGLSQRQLCGDVITRNMLSQIENGAARPSMDTLQYLASRLGKPISFFLAEDAASPNQARIMAARDAYASGNHSAAIAALAEYEAPDAVFDAEYHLLQALCRIALAEAADDPAPLLRDAAAAGTQTPYYTADLEHRRLLVQARSDFAQCTVLPSMDEELLLRAHAALAAGDGVRCIALLNAAEDQTCAPWCMLRGDAACLTKDFAAAVSFYHAAEASDPQSVYPKLEKCYLQLDDYKMAYHYACKQR